MSLKDAIIRLTAKQHGIQPDHPWSKFPSYIAFRHEGSGKWFALFMTLDGKKIGLVDSAPIDIVNVKCKPEMVGSVRKNHGVLPAYHMNKEHWISILLDGTVERKDVIDFIAQSFDLTLSRRKK